MAKRNSLGFEIPPFQQRADVYYTSSDIVVVSVHRDIRGMEPPGLPIMHLKIGSPATELGDALLAGIQSSVDDVGAQDEAQHTDAALAALGAPPMKTTHDRWKYVEKTWKLIISTKNPTADRITLIAMKRHGKGGYVHASLPISAALTSEGIGHELLGIMNAKAGP